MFNLKTLTMFFRTRIAIYPVLFMLLLVMTIGCSKKDSGNPNVLTDVDGNIYHTVIIGTQTWMVENLKTTRYNDSTLIPNVTDNAAWVALSSGAYGWYNNDLNTSKDVYGALYNWYAVSTGKLAPKGWHVPSESEWQTLADYLGGVTVAAGKLKDSGTTHWVFSSGATNETGFTALPGGYRLWGNGSFSELGSEGYWWCSSSTGSSPNNMQAFIMTLTSNSLQTQGYWPWVTGFSVRCLKN